jgi:hypothetical protein
VRELWRSVDEFPTYLVSNFGRVKRIDSGRILRPGGRTHRGYIQYHFFDEYSHRYVRYIHRLNETGEEFRSISDCARFLNKSLSSVWYALRKGTSTAGVHLEEVIS